MSGCGADTEANTLSTTLLDGVLDFEITLPDFTDEKYQIPEEIGNNLFDQVNPLTNEDLTERTLNGEGTFDYLMAAFKVHLQKEFDAGRITGEQYTKSYIALTEGAMSNATQFLLGKDQAYWSAVTAQIAARRAQIELVTTRIQAETAKTQLQTLVIEAKTAEANFALSRMRLATESMDYCTRKYNLENMLPQQKTLLLKQIDQQIAETSNTTKQGLTIDAELALYPLKNDRLLKETLGIIAQNLQITKQTELTQKEIDLAPNKAVMLLRQIAYQEAQTLNVGKQNTALDNEAALQPYKVTAMKEQAEAQRAQTQDTRSDGTPVSGSVGKQRELYAQQITSYKRDAEMKAARVFIDAWVTMKTLDEGLAPPNGFANTNLDIILGVLKANNNLG